MTKPCTVIGIAGPSGSGKSTLCQRLQQHFAERLTLVAEDAYYCDQSHISLADRALVNYDHPDSLEHGLLAEHLMKLKQGNLAEGPCYDFANHTRTQQKVTLKPAPVILIEGILLLAHEKLRQQLDIKVYLDTENAICLDRRIQRDITERGRLEPDIRRQYRETVEPMLQEYVIPSRQHADIIIPTGRDNPVAESLLISYLSSIC